MRGAVLKVAAATVALLALGEGRPARAEAPPMSRIDVEERVGWPVPQDLVFTDASGRRVKLGDYFDGERPVLLLLAYIRCKMLCSLVLRAMTDAVSKLDLVPGDDYRILTVSIDPRELPSEATAKRDEILAEIGRPGQRDRWTYLVGREPSIEELADSLGFRYAWDPRSEQFAHPAVVFVLTPDGIASRYFYGLDLPAADLEEALAAAARSELRTSIAEAVLGCFRFDPALREHRDKIQRYFRLGSSLVFAALFSLVVGLFLWERRRRRS